MKLKAIEFSLRDRVDQQQKAVKAREAGEEFQSVSDELVDLILAKYKSVRSKHRESPNAVTLYKPKNNHLCCPGIRITRTFDIVMLRIDNAQGDNYSYKYFKMV